MKRDTGKATKVNNVIAIDDGTKELILENMYGEEICKLHIRPGDFSIIDRARRLQDSVPEIIEPLEHLNLNADGTAEDEDAWQTLKMVEERLLKCLSDLFDTDDVHKIFEKRFMFSSVRGTFFFNIVLEALIAKMQEVFNEEAKLTEQKLGPYLKPIGGGQSAGETA